MSTLSPSGVLVVAEIESCAWFDETSSVSCEFGLVLGVSTSQRARSMSVGRARGASSMHGTEDGALDRVESPRF